MYDIPPKKVEKITRLKMWEVLKIQSTKYSKHRRRGELTWLAMLHALRDRQVDSSMPERPRREGRKQERERSRRAEPKD